MRCTLCPVQQGNQETLAGAVVIWADVTGQSAAHRLVLGGKITDQCGEPD